MLQALQTNFHVVKQRISNGDTSMYTYDLTKSAEPYIPPHKLSQTVYCFSTLTMTNAPV